LDTVTTLLFDSFGGFIFVFIKMALIVLLLQMVFTIEVLSFTKSNCCEFITKDEWPPIKLPQSTGLSRLGTILVSYDKLQSKTKTIPEFKDAQQLTSSASL